MNEYQRGVYRAAELINLGWTTGHKVIYGTKHEAQPYVSQRRCDDYAEWTMCWGDVTGFVYAERQRVSQSIPIGSPLRFGMEQTFELIRQAQQEHTLFEDATAARIKKAVTDIVDRRLRKLNGLEDRG